MQPAPMATGPFGNEGRADYYGVSHTPDQTDYIRDSEIKQLLRYQQNNTQMSPGWLSYFLVSVGWFSYFLCLLVGSLTWSCPLIYSSVESTHQSSSHA